MKLDFSMQARQQGKSMLQENLKKLWIESKTDLVLALANKDGIEYYQNGKLIRTEKYNDC